MTNDAFYLSALPPGVASWRIDGVRDLSMHVLEAGERDAPLLLLLHGFPELAFSWRKIMAPLAAAGYWVVAPDQRGYGLTRGGAAGYDVDLTEFGMPSLVADAGALLDALGRDRAAAVIGHDFGAPVAAWTALLRPERFGGAVLMSAPFAGPPGDGPVGPTSLAAELAALTPARKHYMLYYGERGAAAEMLGAPHGFAKFLRDYYHCKSADLPGAAAHLLPEVTAEALAVMPRYYIMLAEEGMAEAAASMAHEGPAPDWLPDAELAVYAEAFRRAGLQPGLNWYRRMTSAEAQAELAPYRGRRIEIPTSFIAGAQDWGVWQAPGALASMETRATADYRGATLIDGAGHWVQQEKPAETVEAILAFLRGL